MAHHTPLHNTSNTTGKATHAETLLTFPCQFPIKAMGLATQDIQSVVLEILGRHTSTIDPAHIRQRSSSNGKWLSVTIILEAESKSQLDAIYQDLTAHEAIVYAL